MSKIYQYSYEEWLEQVRNIVKSAPKGDQDIAAVYRFAVELQGKAGAMKSRVERAQMKALLKKP